MDQCVLQYISNFNSDFETVYSMHENNLFKIYLSQTLLWISMTENRNWPKAYVFIRYRTLQSASLKCYPLAQGRRQIDTAFT